MSFLRHNLLPLALSLIAALAVLFVSTASIACEVALDRDMPSMSMGADCEPCEQKAAKPSCQKACLVFCQGLALPTSDSGLARTYASVWYPAFEAVQTAFTAEADDPPPRP